VLAPIFATVGVWRPLVISVGLLTMLTGGWRALRQHDLKRILAFGTVSQLGFMVVLFGAGVPEATEAGVILLLAHALFKAGLFLVVGVIDHQAHTRDIRALGRYQPGWGWPQGVAVVLGASMAGLPLVFGFIAKEAAYESWVHGELWGSRLVLAGLVLGSVLTFAYTARLLLGAFRPGMPTERVAADPAVAIDAVPAPKTPFWVPAGLLGALTLLLGLVPGLANGLVEQATLSLDPESHPHGLAIWHGVNEALLLSALTIGLGLALTLGGAVVAKVQERAPRLTLGEPAYLGALRGMNRLADRSTGIVQSGSLPIYLGVILIFASVVPGMALIGAPIPDLPPLVSGPGDWAAAGLIVVGGVGAVVIRHRMSAVLCLGAVGVGMALVFVLQGAPDLALTQLGVDIIGSVVFVLVLRHLPGLFFERPTIVGRTFRLIVSALVGVVVFAFILITGGARVAPPVSLEFLERSLADGGGRNVVNIVVIDIRGFDTMGEITVLTVAAMGVYALARLSRNESALERSFAPGRRARRRDEAEKAEAEQAEVDAS
jgi:multicomponent Na+:H+ antiporter subunit A